MIRVSYDHADLDMSLICGVVKGSYWGLGRKDDDIIEAARVSRVVSLLDGADQIAYARILSDGVFSAFLYDVFVVERLRGQGFGRQIVQAAFDHPDLSNVCGWMLVTRYHHDLYRKFGFKDADPGRYMTWMRPDVPNT